MELNLFFFCEKSDIIFISNKVNVSQQLCIYVLPKENTLSMDLALVEVQRKEKRSLASIRRL